MLHSGSCKRYKGYWCVFFPEHHGLHDHDTEQQQQQQQQQQQHVHHLPFVDDKMKKGIYSRTLVKN
jgi:hypothetical protein